MAFRKGSDIRRIAQGLALLAFVPGVTGVARAETPRYQEYAVVRAGFGPAAELFGRSGIESSRKTTRLVTGFAASDRYIAIPDRVKRDVKIFTTSGVFDKAIRLRLTASVRPDTVRARDVAIRGDTLYVLVDDLPDGSKTIPPAMRIAAFDIGTGICRSVWTLDTSSLVPMEGARTARGADAFFLHPGSGHLWLVDSIRQMGFELVFSGDRVALGKHPVFGWGGEAHRVRTDDNVSSINLLDGTGQLKRRLPESGVMVAVTQTGDAFAVLQYVPMDGKLDWGITVYDSAGDRLGLAPRPNRSWLPFKAPVMERKYELVKSASGPELYELYANADGVRVVRWSR
jgi:hypothetical protein